MGSIREVLRLIGDGFGTFSNGERICVEKKILKFTLIAIESDVFDTITKRGGRTRPLLITSWFAKKLNPFIFQSGYYLPMNPMVNNLKDSILFTSFHNQLRRHGPIKRKINHRNPYCPGFLGSQTCQRRHPNHFFLLFLLLLFCF